MIKLEDIIQAQLNLAPNGADVKEIERQTALVINFLLEALKHGRALFLRDKSIICLCKERQGKEDNPFFAKRLEQSKIFEIRTDMADRRPTACLFRVESLVGLGFLYLCPTREEKRSGRAKDAASGTRRVFIEEMTSRLLSRTS